MIQRAQAEIDLSAIAANVALLQKHAGVPLMAVVKADAYGHGLGPGAKTAISAGAPWLRVALLEEAIALRSAGISAPVLSWLVPPGSDYKNALLADVDLAVPSI